MADHRGPALLVLRGPIAPQDIPALCRCARELLERSDAELVVCDVETLVAPDAVAVEALARVQLTARQLGRGVRLRHPCHELRELLAFMGLADILR
ncbi:MAG TPA: STAS domain-containing protein [Actinomycetota bacterium]|nr:STAS domain-containing protein [Actinomycetota bacterium]